MLKASQKSFSLVKSQNRFYTPVLTKETVRKQLVEAEYAVRGAIAIEGQRLKTEL